MIAIKINQQKKPLASPGKYRVDLGAVHPVHQAELIQDMKAIKGVWSIGLAECSDPSRSFVHLLVEDISPKQAWDVLRTARAMAKMAAKNYPASIGASAS